MVNWEELRAYFTVAIPETNQESRYKARTLLDMLNDRIIFLYFHFVSPLVTEFERVNAFFQATDADPEEMSKELLSHSKSLQARINDSDGSPLPIEKVDFGGKFEEETRAFLSSQAHAVSALDKIKELKQRCLLFLMEATDQVKKRLPESHNLFRGLSSLHPMKVLHAKERRPFNQLPLPHLRHEFAEQIEEQYRKILHRDWQEESVFYGGVPDDTVKFWCGSNRFRNALNQNPFQDLANYALACLTHPVSNAAVERTFSEVTAIKTKSRNRMGLELLKALVIIRNVFHLSGKCCRNLIVTKRMLELFNAAQMYDDSKSSSNDNQDNQDDMSDGDDISF